MKKAAEAISKNQIDQGSLAQEILKLLADSVKNSAKAIGLEKEVRVENVTTKEAGDMSKVDEKLDEIKAKVSAIKESVETDHVVVKSYFENGE